MRIGYSCWGFLGPGILDTPDGGRSHRRTLVDGLGALGHQLVLLQRTATCTRPAWTSATTTVGTRGSQNSTC